MTDSTNSYTPAKKFERRLDRIEERLTEVETLLKKVVRKESKKVKPKKGE